MKIGYKSESGTVWLAAATAVLLLACVPWRLWWLALLAWACVSRRVARGARNTARPRCLSADDYAAAVAASAAAGSCLEDDGDVVVMSRDMPMAVRPVAVVTGTNSGIGFHTAVGLAVEGYEVVLTCRSAALTRQTAARVRAAAERRRRAHAADYVHAPQPICVCGEWPLECDDFASVRAFAAAFAANYGNRNVQVLVNNAGGMQTELVYSRHCAQLEAHVAANVCGPLLLTELLLPLLARHGGRVVYVASEAHRFPQMALEGSMLSAWRRHTSPAAASRDGGSCHEGTCVGLVGGKLLQALQELNQGEAAARGVLAARTVRGAFVRYGVSKLLNTYHAHVIARRYCLPRQLQQQQQQHEATPRVCHRGCVYACSLHPGCVATNFSRQLLRWPLLNTMYKYAALLFLKGGDEGAQTTLHCAMCPRSELALVVPATAPQQQQQQQQSPRGAGGGDGVASTSSADVAVDKARAVAEAAAVSAYFVECTNKTHQMLLAYAWDVQEAERVVRWCRQLVGLAADDHAAQDDGDTAATTRAEATHVHT